MSATDFKDEKASPRPGSGQWTKRDVEAHAIHVETHDIFEDDSGVDPVYQAKARILNDAIQEIGMGKYQVCKPYPFCSEATPLDTGLSAQWYLFIVAGFGWFS